MTQLIALRWQMSPRDGLAVFSMTYHRHFQIAKFFPQILDGICADQCRHKQTYQFDAGTEDSGTEPKPGSTSAHT
jgi:hypothetical protein